MFGERIREREVAVLARGVVVLVDDEDIGIGFEDDLGFQTARLPERVPDAVLAE